MEIISNVNIKMNFIFLRVMEVWTQWVPCKVYVTPEGVTYFARAPLRSYFHDPQKNKIYFLNIIIVFKIWNREFSTAIQVLLCRINAQNTG